MAVSQADVEIIFNEARSRPPRDRAAYLHDVCGGDSALMQRIEQFLNAQAELGSFLESPACLLNRTIDQPVTEAPGTVIGPYKLLQQIGEGGFGVVFMAEQKVPVRRKVALKVLKPGMDTRQVVARFEAERQALALMDHPNIAHVFDGGQTPSGRPYFVMELVRGVPITEYCDQNRLAIRERLDLFVTVCQAVQHAHQKGVIHRDLKPSNILIASHDGTPVPKVIDFGIAKALSGNLTDKSIFTRFEQMIGTPLYMSPEQAGQSSLDVDTRSDIYSLGVLLYELLTGTTPFDKDQFSKLGYDELRRIIRETEPRKPSTQLSTLGQAATTASTNRNSEPRKLSQQIRGELDWIVMKSLEKDRNRRYETASSFAADVERFLNDEPVQACPTSVGYRLRKFARRNKAVMVATLAVFMALSAGMASTTVALFEAQHQQDMAENDRIRAEKAGVEAEKARVEAENARIEERKQREIAQNALAYRVERDGHILDFFCLKVLHTWRPSERGGLGKNVTVRDAIAATEKEITPWFKGYPIVERDIRRAMAMSYHDCGEVQLANTQLRRVVELVKDGYRPNEYYPFLAVDIIWYHNLIGTGNFDQALALLQDILAKQLETVGPDHVETLCMVNFIYYTYADMHKGNLAVPLFKKHLAAVDAKLGPDHPLTLRSMHNLAFVYTETGQPDLAVPILEEVRRKETKILGADHTSTLVTMSSLGMAYFAGGKPDLGQRLLEEAAAAQKKKLGPDHPYVLGGQVAASKKKLGPVHPQTLTSLGNLIECFVKAKQPEKALPLLHPYVDGQKKRFPHMRWECAANQIMWAGELQNAGQAEKAAPFLTECLSLRFQCRPEDDWRTFNAESMLGGSLAVQKKYEEAEPFLLDGYKGLKEREAKIPPVRRVHLSEALERLVQLYDAWGKKDEAAKWRKELAAQRESEKKIEKPKSQP